MKSPLRGAIDERLDRRPSLRRRPLPPAFPPTHGRPVDPEELRDLLLRPAELMPLLPQAVAQGHWRIGIRQRVGYPSHFVPQLAERPAVPKEQFEDLLGPR